MLVKVTQKHIDKGIRCNAYGCPVALAIIDATKTDKTVTVGISHLYIGNIRYTLPQAVGARIVDFDKKQQIYPFEFELYYVN